MVELLLLVGRKIGWEFEMKMNEGKEGMIGFYLVSSSSFPLLLSTNFFFFCLASSVPSSCKLQHGRERQGRPADTRPFLTHSLTSKIGRLCPRRSPFPLELVVARSFYLR